MFELEWRGEVSKKVWEIVRESDGRRLSDWTEFVYLFELEWRGEG